MKVIAIYQTVYVTYSDGEKVSVKCKSIQDALTFSERFSAIYPYRDRATTDKNYLNDFYHYLKEKGLFEKSLYKSKIAMLRKYQLLRSLYPVAATSNG
ncbi:TPA: hypothetical protein N2O37_004737 [Citrobacter freundii]|nr:hypothetical protein [Citrobacter freundii]